MHSPNSREDSLVNRFDLGRFAASAAVFLAAVFTLSAAGAKAPPATPGSVTVTRADGALTASWAAVEGARSYHVTYSSDGGGSWSLAALNHSDNSITIGVDNANSYLVGVRARNEHGDSGWRNSPSAGPWTPPDDDTEAPAPDPEPEPLPDPAALSLSGGSAGEGDAITFTVTLDKAVSGGFTATPSFTDGTATKGTDYTENTTALTFTGSAGESHTFTVSTTEDTDVEADETFTVGLSVSGTTESVTATSTATGTITNDDTETTSVTLSLNPSSVSEDAGSTSVTVTAAASSAVAANTPLTVSIGGGTATSGTDYTSSVSELALEIPAGGTHGVGSFKLTPVYDTDIEGKETIAVSGSGSGLSVSGTSLTLTDSEEVSAEWWFGARLSVSPGSVSENGGKQLVTVTAEVSEWGTSTSDLSYVVTVGKGGDSAVSGTDYKAVSKFNVTVKANRRSGSNSFNLEPIGDADWEGDETITIHAEGTGGAQSTSLTLTDEGDRPYAGPQVTLSANPSKLSEADGATTVTVTATSTAHSTARTVAVSVGRSGTARSGTDYAAVSDFTISLAKDATSATGTFTLTPTQDKLAEGDETITVAGNVQGSTAKLTGTTLTLTDDDAAPAVTLSVSPVVVTENGGAKTVTVTATSAAAAAKARTLLVAVGNRRKDTATPGTDFTVVPAFNITIAANATTATGTFTLTPTNDTSVEDAESISIDGTPESGGADFTVGGAAMALTDDDAQPAVTLTATPSSVDEAALATSVTVKATAASAVAWARTVAVSVGKTGSAASGTDYAAVSNFDIRIAANATSGTGTFSLKPTQDTTNEGDETIGVAGTSLNTTVTGATVTLADDDINPAVTLSVSPASVSESASATTVTVTATGASAMTTDRTVSVKVGDSGTATSGTDYAAVSDFTITIAANATSGTGTFTLTPTQDTTVEGGETIGVSGSSTATTVTGTTVGITDDDTYPAVTLSVSTSSLSESASATSVTVTATAASAISSARTVTVSVGQTGTAAPGSDYAAVTDFDITIAANATSGTGTFTLTPTQDTEVEYNETIGVDGSSPNTTMTNATITLTDDDKDTVTLSLNRRTLGEEASGTSVTVTATAATAIAVSRTVTVSVGGSGTATSGTDYSAVSDFTITIAANATSGTGSFTLTPTQDTTNEGNETIGIAGTNSLSTVTGTTLTLVDDDQDTISLSSNKTGISESWSGSVQITATRPSATTSAVDVTVVVGAGTDAATEGVDYQEVADFTITIPANQTSATKNFTLTGIRDAVSDNNERLSIGGLATGYKVSGVANGILIFEWYSTIELKADVSSVSEHDGATTVTVTAHIDPTVYGNVYVPVSVGGGTATSGTDYAAVSNFTITIPNKASSATGTFTLTPTQDALLESDETININGSGHHFNFYAGRGTSITLTDAQTVALSATPSSVSEGAPPTQVAVTATATGTVSTPRTVTVSVGGTGTATSGTDYAAVSDFDITIPANKTGATNTFTLTPTKDSAGEGDETIGVSGSSTGAYVYPTDLTLTDTNPAVTLSASPSSISEGGGATSVTVTATASAALATARTVTVSVGGSGTATSGTDYAAVSDFTITIAANETSGTGTFTLTPTDDTALEGDETIHVTGTSSEAATISRTTLTLTDDDLPTIALTTVPSYVDVAEDGSRESVTVRATAAAAMKAETTVTLSIGAGGDSATKTTDYTVSNVQTITIPKDQSTAEASFELTPVEDTAVEGNESISVSGSSSGGHTVTGTSVTLTDDDKYRITLSASPSSVGEGASATSVTVTATAGSAITSARTVKVKVGGSGTATSGTDYAAVSDFDVTIAANATSGTGTFTLTPTQDTSVEGSETIGVSGTSALARVAGTTVTLSDDDSYPAITLSANPSSVSEGASGTSVTVTATAASAISSARTVTVSVGGSGTATAGTDYATVADFDITIAANATSGTGTFTLTPTQDTSVEGSETVGVAGASASSTVTGTTVTLSDDDTHAITLSASPSSVSESKASETITVTATLNLARAAATAVTVSVGESGDEATSGTDYKAVSDFTITIAANKTSGTGTFTFEPKTDSAYEGLESVTISGTTASGGGGGANANSANTNTSIPVTDTSLSIRDASNYPAVSLSAAPSSVGEDAGATSVTVTATAASAIASSREVTVSVGGSGTAASGTDYTAVSDYIVKIAANATSGTGTFTLTPTDDVAVEGSETIGVAGSSLSTTVTATTVTLTDDDNATLTINDTTAAEGGDLTFTVTLDTAVVGGLTVTPGYTNGTASNSDYTANTTGISFSGTANETKTFTVSTTQDDVVEANETFTVGLSVSGTTLTDRITSTDTGTGTISSGTENNVDTATLTINDVSASEGDSLSFTVTLSEAVQGGLTVTPGSFTNGTAASGDYEKKAVPASLTFTGTKGETHSFKVPSTEDAVLEANETFTVGMSVSGTTLGDRITSTDTGTGTINNDDSAAVTVNDASATEGDSLTFTVTLSAAVQGGLTVTPDFTNGTAASGDYEKKAVPASLTFTGTKGETHSFKVPTTEDAVLEADETFTVGLSVSNQPAGTTVTASDEGTGTIDDDDSAAVTIADADADEGDDITFTVTLSEAVQGGLTVTPDFTDVSAVEGTDYDENTAAITFTGTKGETQTFTVSTTEEEVVEGAETFTVGLSVSNQPTGTTVTASDEATGTINNDDGAVVTVNDASADEGGSITFTVTLGAAVQGGLTVTPDFTDVTAAEGTDYDENTAALSFTGTKGETKTFTVATTEDAVLEADETFTVGLTASGAPEGTTVTDTDTGTGTIDNDDSAAVTIADAKADEGDDITFTVTLSEAVQDGLTVTPDFTDGTAAEGTDYDENTAALTFTGTKGETQTFTVSTTEDAVFEGNETFTVGLTASDAPSGTSVTDTDTGTGTIDNDDGAVVTVNDAGASEGNEITFTVSLGTAVQGGLKVTPDFTDVTAAEGTDYDENTAALTFTGTKGETQTFTVSTTEDAVLEHPETFTVGLSVSNTPLPISAADTGTGTINNDDSAAVTVNDASADEGEAISFTVTLSEAVQGGLTVTPGYTNGTAASGDYTKNTEALSFSGTKGETKTFTVSTTEEAVLEHDETFTVGLSVSNAPTGVTATDTGTGTIDNDDSAEVTVNDADAEEGDAITFTVTLDEAVQGGLTVTPKYTDVTAVEGTDYTKNTTALTFTGTKGETETFTVSTTEDAVVEYPETFTVGLGVSKAPSGVTATDTGTGTIKNDDTATVSISDGSATESSAITFTVTLSAAVQGGFTVTPGYTDGTAVQGTDYTPNTAALTFTGTANETQTFNVATIDDEVLEGNETFTVSLTISKAPDGVTAPGSGSNSVSAKRVAWASSQSGVGGVGMINNDDSSEVTIDDASAEEGNAMTFTVTLSEAVQGGLTVTPGYSNVTAAGTDYTENTTPLSFNGTKGETKKFRVLTTHDKMVESDETFSVDLAVSGAPAGVTAPVTGTGTIDNNDARPAVTLTGPSGTQPGAFEVDAVFSDDVTGFERGDLSVTNGSVSTVFGSGTDYAVAIIPAASGTVTIEVPENVAADDTGDLNTASNPLSVDVALVKKVQQPDTAPTVSVSGPSGPVGRSFYVAVIFSEAVTDFEQSEVSVTNGKVTAFSGSDDRYTAGIAPAASGTVTVDVAGGVAFDGDGNGNSTLPTPYTVEADLENPSVTVSGPSDLQTGAFDVAVAFSEPVTGFEQDDLWVGNGTATAFSGSEDSYSATIMPAASGTVTVDVPAGAAEDAAGNGNTPAPQYSVQASMPTVGQPDGGALLVTISGPAGPVAGAFDVAVAFTDSVTGFERNDVAVTNGTMTAFSGSGADYTATIAPAASGTVTVDVAAWVATDAQGNPNAAADYYSVEADLDAPSVSLSGPAGPVGAAFDVAVTFSEPVTGFEQGDVSVTNGAVTAFSGTGSSYTATIAPAAGGTVTVDVAARVAADAAGNQNSAAASWSVQADLAAPTATIGGPAGPVAGAFDATVTFSEPVSGFAQSDVSVGNGAVTAFSGSGASYTATIAPAASGTVTVDVAAGAARDAAGNGNDAAASWSVQADLVAPSVTVSGPAAAVAGSFDVTLSFSEPVTGFEQNDVSVTNGSVTAFSGSGASYTATITPAASGTVTVNVAAGAAFDAAGNGNSAAAQYAVQADLTAPSVTVSGPAGPVGGAFDATVTFSEPVSGFEQSDVSVGNGAVTAFSGSGSAYAATISPTTDGTVTVDVAADAATDAHAHGNSAAVQYAVAADLTAPSLGLGGPLSVEGVYPFDVTVTFSEAVTGFEQGDVSVSNGAVTALSGSGSVYTATIAPSATGKVTAAVGPGAARDRAGHANPAGAAFSTQVVAAASIQSANRPPVFSVPSAERSVAENTAPAAAIGSPVTATDPDGDALTYALSGADAGSFSLDAASGQLRVLAALDYEARVSYAVTVEATDPHGASAALAVAVSVTDAAEPPAAPAAPAVTALSRTRLSLSWTAPATPGRPAVSGYDVQYRVAGSGAAFADAGHAGTGTSLVLEDLSADTAYEAQVRAVNDEGAGDWSPAGTGRTLKNNAPAFAGLGAGRSVAENTPAGEAVGSPVAATDADGDVLTYTLSGADAAAFDLDADSGQLRTRAALDYEARASYAVTVTAIDPHGASARQAVTVSVTDAAEPPAAPAAPAVAAASAQSLSLSWTAPATPDRPAVSGYDVQYRPAGSGAAFADAGHAGTGTTMLLEGLSADTEYEVQVRAVNDEGAGDWSAPGRGRTDLPPLEAPVLSDQDAAAGTAFSYRFDAVAEATGYRAAQTGGAALPAWLGFDAAERAFAGTPPAAGLLNIEVTATGESGRSASASFALRIAQAVPVAADDRAAVAEGGSVRIEVLANDSDFDGDALSVRLLDEPGHGTVEVDAAGVVTYVHDGSETTADRFGYQADDGTALSATATVTIEVTPVNDAPTAEAGPDQEVGEGAAVTLSGSGTDPEGETLTFAWTQSRGPAVALSEAAAAAPSFTAPAQLAADTTLVFELVVSDASGAASAPDAVTVTVRADDDPPVFAGPYAFDLEENRDGSSTPVVLGSVEATDPEGGAVTYALTDGAALFALDAASGELSYVGPGEDAEAVDGHLLTVEAADAGGLTASVEVTVAIVAVDEAGAVTLSTYRPSVGQTVQAEVSDPDGPAIVEGWQWQSSEDGNAWEDITGATAKSYKPVMADKGMMLCATATYTTDESIPSVSLSSDPTDRVEFTAAERDRTRRLALGAVARSVAEEVVETLQARMAAPVNEESHLTVNGQRAVIGEDAAAAPAGVVRSGAGFGGSFDAAAAGQGTGIRPPMSGLDNPLSGSFRLSMDEADQWTLWGREANTFFDGRPEEGIGLDGRLLSGFLGMDYRRTGSATGLGLALAHNHGKIGYSSTAFDADAAVVLTNLFPYLHWNPRNGLDLWSVAGYGLGHLDLAGEPGSVALRLAAAGMRYDLRSLGRIDMAAKTDAFAVQLRPRDGSAAAARRLRLALEGRTQWQDPAGDTWRPALELGLRWDDGDDRGAGAEFAGEMAYANARHDFDLEARIRRLLVHQDRGFRQWGASFVFRRASADRRGLQLALGPEWGEGNSQVEGLWRGQLGGAGAAAPDAADWRPDGMTLSSGYGLDLSRSWRMTPFVEAGAGRTPRLQVGARWEWNGEGTRQIEVFGEQRGAPGEPADRGIRIRGVFDR